MNVSTQTIKICTDLTCTLSQQQLKEINDISSPSAPSYESSSISHDDEFLPPTLADLDVGTFPSLSLSFLPSGEMVVLEVHGDGFCYNSDWYVIYLKYPIIYYFIVLFCLKNYKENKYLYIILW